VPSRVRWCGIGISLATSTLAERTQFHQSRLVEHAFPSSPYYQETLRHFAERFARSLFQLTGRDTAYWYRRGRGVLVGEGRMSFGRWTRWRRRLASSSHRSRVSLTETLDLFSRCRRGPASLTLSQQACQRSPRGTSECCRPLQEVFPIGPCRELLGNAPVHTD
jgi:hypothetical protein